jgi:hypothetical protein
MIFYGQELDGADEPIALKPLFDRRCRQALLN